MNDSRRGTAFTFYSFKGGVGRSMCMANVAALLAKWGHSVLAIDFDLEAPGLERFFSTSPMIRRDKSGIVDLIHAFSSGQELDWRDCIVDTEFRVDLLSAGRDDDQYVDKLRSLDLKLLFKEQGLGRYVEKIRTEWLSVYDFVLIDSRTGLTDMGGMCTVHLPDILVVLFTATESSISGSLNVISAARKAMSLLPIDRGNLMVLPVPARDESRTEYERASEWKDKFAARFAAYYKDWLPSGVTPREAVETIRIPYVPYWSFGERLPAIEERTSDAGSLGYAYEGLARLCSRQLEWYEALSLQKPGPVPISQPHHIDENWVRKNRNVAIDGLRAANRKGWFEMTHSITPTIPKSQPELLTIAEQAAIHPFGWPIGVVLRNRSESRPRPTNDGIVATIKTSESYDHWALTGEGDFYTLMSLFEDSRRENADSVFYDTRIVRTTEAVMHALNVYKAFGVPANSMVSISVRYGGLKGRRLRGASAFNLEILSSADVLEDGCKASSVFSLGVSSEEIVEVVKELCRPLFVLFDFTVISDGRYTQLVTDFLKGVIRRV